MNRTGAPWREPAATDRCTASVAAVARDLFTWHRRGVTVRMVEPTRDGGVLLGVDAPIEAIPRRTSCSPATTASPSSATPGPDRPV
jgi:hypothetical protein